MKISCIIPTTNRVEALINCLDSISKQSVTPDEIIIINQGEYLSQSFFRNASYNLLIKIVNIKRKSLTNARNVGIKMAKYNQICFLDDDVILHKDYFNIMINAIKENNFDGVQGNILNHDVNWTILKKIASFIIGKGYPSSYCRADKYLNVYQPINKEREGKKYLKADWISGCNSIWKKEVLINCGMYDDEMERYCFMEDVDLSLRAKKLGYKLAFITEGKLIHNTGEHYRAPNKIKTTMYYFHRYYIFHKLNNTNPLNEIILFYCLYMRRFMFHYNYKFEKYAFKELIVNRKEVKKNLKYFNSKYIYLNFS